MIIYIKNKNCGNFLLMLAFSLFSTCWMHCDGRFSTEHTYLGKDNLNTVICYQFLLSKQMGQYRFGFYFLFGLRNRLARWLFGQKAKPNNNLWGIFRSCCR